jgi:predicted DsbA family dithiol-disulfide isomerase
MYDAMCAHRRRWPLALDDDHLVRYAATAGAGRERVRTQLAAGTYEARVRADCTSGVRSGMRGAPTSFVDGVRFDGDWRDVAAFAWALGRAAGRDPQAPR